MTDYSKAVSELQRVMERRCRRLTSSWGLHGSGNRFEISDLRLAMAISISFNLRFEII